MPISDEYGRAPLDAIKVNRETRQRRVIDTRALKESVRQHGVLIPIVLTRDFLLIAGERRLQASRELGLPDIPFRFLDSLDQSEAEIIELEENIKRQDLEWQELVGAVAKIHSLFLKSDSEWTMAETGERCSLTQSTISIYLRVYNEMGDERIKNAGTVREAYNIITRKDQRAAGDALEEILGTTDKVVPINGDGSSSGSNGAGVSTGNVAGAASPGVITLPSARTKTQAIADRVNEVLVCESFLHWAPKYQGKKFNVLHCDFPYGISVFDGPQAGGERHGNYDDSKEVYFALLKCFCENLDKFMALSAHMIFWYSDKYRDETRRIFKELAPSIVLLPYQLIWVKSDNAGISSDAKRTPRHIYETALFGIRGQRQLVKIAADAYSAPTDKRFHTSTKPEPMLRHFMQMIVDENSSILDPTCGSGSALRAAESLGAKRLLGMDIDERTIGSARAAMRQGRMLGAAHKEL